MEAIFFQIGVMIVLATVGAYFARILKQPLIPAYILAGIILGPGFHLIQNSEVIKSFEVTGIAFLLFIVGLELSFKHLRDVGKIGFIGGSIQVLLLFAVGFMLAHALGFIGIEAAYVGLIVAFSSTMIVIKLLSDKKELMTLHGKMIIGILLMQDILAIFALTALSSVHDGFNSATLFYAFIQAGAILALAYGASRWVFPLMFKYAARSQELFFLLALSVCFIFSIVFSYLGFSIAIGAFVAGVALANLTYNVEIIAKVKSLKDFFSTLFFVSLGLGITIPDLRGILKPLILLTLVVILVKPLVVMFLCSFFGYTKKVSFLTALSLAQVSEFSIIIATLGLELGHISQNLFTITVLLIIITLILTAYFIKFDFLLYSFFSRWLNVFDLMSTGKHLQYLPQKQQDLDYDVILVGYDRIGYNVLKSLERLKQSFIVIDYNPDLIKRLVSRKIPCIYGDIGDDEIMERLNFKHAKLVISTIPTMEDNKRITKHLRAVNKKAVLFVTANVIEEAMELYKLGADYVVLPHFLGGERVSTLVEEYSTDLKKVIKNKLAHIDELRDRLSLSQEHPLKA